MTYHVDRIWTDDLYSKKSLHHKTTAYNANKLTEPPALVT